VVSLGDSFSFPFRDPGWLRKLLLQGLILAIPVVGVIAILGWMLQTLDNLREGRSELAPAGFHLRRGAALFGVEIAYYVLLYVPYGLLSVLSLVLAQRSVELAVLLYVLAQLVELGLSLLFAFVFPAVVVVTYEGGFRRGLDVSEVWRLATADPTGSVLAALVMIAAGLVSGLGILALGVGVLLTSAYGGAVIAGAAAWYSRAPAGPAPAPEPAPAP